MIIISNFALLGANVDCESLIAYNYYNDFNTVINDKPIIRHAKISVAAKPLAKMESKLVPCRGMLSMH